MLYLACLFVLILSEKTFIQAYYTDENGPEDYPSTEDFPPSLSLKLDLQNGKNAWVFDNVIPFSQRDSFDSYFFDTQLDNLNFTLVNYSWGLKHNTKVGLVPWKKKMDKQTFQNFAIWKRFVPLLKDTLNGKAFIESMQSELAHALDARPPMQSESCHKDRYVAVLFTDLFWEHNGYGQISFLTELVNKNVSSKPRLEIIESVHPRRGRLVVYPSCQMSVFHPPQPSYKYNMHIIKMWFTTSQPSDTAENEENSTNGETEGFESFRFTLKPDREIDYEKCLKRKYYDSSGEKGIFVFDDLFTEAELLSWKQHLFKHATPGSTIYDTEQTEDNDNVAVISSFNVSLFVQTPMWKRVQGQISFVSGEDRWYPYDVAMNYVRSSDNTRIHPDAETHQFEYTYLLYLTEGLDSRHFGETIWVEKRDPTDGITQFTGPGGEEYEPFAAVKPKYGRVVIFRNTIEHSARPLTAEYLGDRFSFAVKVARSKRNALVKLLYESLEQLDSSLLSEKMRILNSQLQHGMHDEGKNSKISTEILERIYYQVASKIKEQNTHNTNEIIERLK